MTLKYCFKCAKNGEQKKASVLFGSRHFCIKHWKKYLKTKNIDPKEYRD